ncbi:hypothetical protein [Embleya scabrispora]|uniref:hypothetical protein n=1 Tax=Embleya scabrispora TaxID=159449 RepID=UPI000367B579|nr:hypothetical protein [Embleya scabrispora]MYS86595.1 hypothetical protein [Streptomyces sp. SID5474]
MVGGGHVEPPNTLAGIRVAPPEERCAGFDEAMGHALWDTIEQRALPDRALPSEVDVGDERIAADDPRPA